MSEVLDNGESLPELLQDIEANGVETDFLEWRNRDFRALLVSTEEGARYLIEPREGPNLVTRLAEAGPRLDVNGPRLGVVILRFEGNPDFTLQVGKDMNILGLSRREPSFDPESLYTTSPVTRIRYLEKEAV